MKEDTPAIPGAVVVGLALSLVLDTIAQIAWKKAVSHLPVDASALAQARIVLVSPWFLAAMLAFGAQLLNWLRVLARSDLSFAQPFTALSYISVLMISGYWLNERISVGKVVGVGLILVGVYLVSRTPFRTLGRESPTR